MSMDVHPEHGWRTKWFGRFHDGRIKEYPNREMRTGDVLVHKWSVEVPKDKG